MKRPNRNWIPAAPYAVGEIVRHGKQEHRVTAAAAGAAERDTLFECAPYQCFHLTAADCKYGEQFAFYHWANADLGFLQQYDSRGRIVRWFIGPRRSRMDATHP